jgi:hypothetical protein
MSEVHRMNSLDKVKAEIEHIEGLPNELYLERFPLLQGKGPEELKQLNKKLLKKLDWRFLPTVTVMLLMAYGSVICKNFILLTPHKLSRSN